MAFKLTPSIEKAFATFSIMDNFDDIVLSAGGGGTLCELTVGKYLIH